MLKVSLHPCAVAEFDALTGCKLSSIDIGATVVRMAYSPAAGHVLVAVLEVRSYWVGRDPELNRKERTLWTHVHNSPNDQGVISSSKTKMPLGWE